ncbi:MAG: hypothetical protein U5J95_01255 [Balneolaceae bacterium]|nr:hypothetical protein [Balneolaceae bacterium]
MLSEIESMKKEINSFSITNEEELEAFRLEFLSRKGKIQTMFGKMRRSLKKIVPKLAKE